MGYREDISINKNNMEEECANHPSVHFSYGKKHAEALHSRRLAEVEEQEVAAEADAHIRSQVDKKSTETVIRKMVEGTPSYQEARRRALDAAHEVNVLAAAIEALNAKTKMLGHITSMQLSHWQAEPRSSPQARIADEQATREAQLDGLNDGTGPRKRVVPADEKKSPMKRM